MFVATPFIPGLGDCFTSARVQPALGWSMGAHQPRGWRQGFGMALTFLHPAGPWCPPAPRQLTAKLGWGRPIFLFNGMKYREKGNYCFHKSWLMITKLCLRSRPLEVHYQKTAMLSTQMLGIILCLAFYKCHEL